MFEWWDSLETIMKVLYCIAIPASILLLIQLVLSFIGFSDGGSGIDSSDTSGLDLDSFDLPDFNPSNGNSASASDFSDGSHPSDISTLRLFSLQGIVTFFAVFSWTSIVAIEAETPVFLGIFLGLLFGVAAMFLVAKLVQLTVKLAKNGTLNFKNAIGESGIVYLPIQGNGKSVGKVTLNLQGQFGEFNAITYETAELKTGMPIRVTDLQGDLLVVETEK